MAEKENNGLMANSNCDIDDFKSPKKKKRQKKGKNDRFGDTTTDAELSELTKGYVPANTKRSTNWAVSVFSEWRANTDNTDEACPTDLLERALPADLNKWIPRFVNEVRRQDGNHYPPRTINQLLSGLQRHMIEMDPFAPKILDRSRPDFRPIHLACDSVFHKLHTSGVGTVVRHTAVITEQEEESLWSSGILGYDSPKALQRTIFYYIGKRFCIRGGEEMRKLGPSQFIRSFDPDCVTYVEHGSKNYTGRAADLHRENKRVPCPAVPSLNNRCFVHQLDFYFSKLPKYAFEKDILFVRPKANKPSSSEVPWYESAAVGKNSLATMIREMCKEGGVGKKTNHSLRASGTTAMFQNNVPERVIQSVTGHRSLEALRSYERVSMAQHTEVSNIMMNNAVHCQTKSSSGSHPSTDLSRLCFNNCSFGQMNVNFSAKDEESTD